MASLFLYRRETDWLPASRPPVLEGAYLTRGRRGLCIYHWRRNRWMLARGEAAPKEWKGIDVRLTDSEEQMLKSHLYRRDVTAALPLLRDAIAAHAVAAHPLYAGDPVPLPERQRIFRLHQRACRYFVMLVRDTQGQRLLTPDDRKMCKPFLQGKTVRRLIAEMQENVAAFERGIDL
ncbi:hypothetical protein [Burkholderia pseudomallei]|uniref:hypothetical protein n=1 Tax=Burkholderia pseudomallei TaxID=28450 RepID=UPI0011C4B73E|nr:hypothetical protein [Burkholderia pseudomallei]MBF4048820.1 hypothetical protein [Burkholderia pseudomallei]